MCGIVGLFLKDQALGPQLGALVTKMLVGMSDRGPDSAGIAIYRRPAPPGTAKLTLAHAAPDFAWRALAVELGAALSAPVALEARASHAVLLVPGDAARARGWLAANAPGVRVTSFGERIEIFKETGRPADVAARFALPAMEGTHAVGHTRMATESAVTTEHSHPFSTGPDLCLVHNGSLSNHNRLREWLRRRGVVFSTDNDSEVAAGYLAWRLGEGATLHEALAAALTDLDGFYTFAVGTRDGFAVLRDPFACKPAVLAETDGWVAMASEFRSIADLPGADRATVFEPKPGRVYAWSHAG
jgi:glutamate synthase domain-containing protein 1